VQFQEDIFGKFMNWNGYLFILAGYPATYLAIFSAGIGIRLDIRRVKSSIRPDTGYKKRPDYPAGRISGASLALRR
jgi:hypothetical protein